MSGEWARECKEGLVVSLAPDVCLTPMGGAMVPVPYMIVARLEDAEETYDGYLVRGKPAFTMASLIPHCEGDEAGTGGGVLSGVNQGYCRPVEHSTTMMAGGHWLVREGDLFAMNCAGPEGPANTYGRLVITNEDLSAPGVVLESSEATTTDPVTGQTIVEKSATIADPDTGAITELRERTVIDAGTGRVRVERAKITRGQDGKRTYEASAGDFNPETQRFEWRTSAGRLPEGAEVDPDALAVDYAGRLYLSDEAETFVRSEELDGRYEIADDDPEVLADPEVKAALEEEAACRAELAELERQELWEGAKLGVDAVGMVDPTPVADVIGAGMALSDGDWLGAGLSVVAAVVPFAGDAVAKGIKGTRAAKALAKLDRLLAKRKARLADAVANTGKVKQAAQRKLRRKKAFGWEGPKNPGDGGHAPGAKKTAGGAARRNNQPDLKKWKEKGGTVRENPDGTKTFRRKDGVEVTYDKDGFPDFAKHRHPEVKDVEIEFTGDYYKDNKLADEAAGITEEMRISEKYTWHHHQDGKTMQLIKRNVHQDFFHTGGMSGAR